METKPNFMRAVLTVKDKQYITPHYIRIVLEGDNMHVFEYANEGDNNKIILPVNKEEPLVLPDMLTNTPGSNNGSMRTYTLRSLDIKNNEMIIDFVMHGESGPASKWAINAQKGDELGVLMKEKRKPIYKPADWYLIVGDHTALPVISVILENLPANAKGKAVLEVYSEADVIHITAPENIEIVWSFNNQPGAKTTLPDLINEQEITAQESKFVFAAAEYSTVKQIQEKLRATEGLHREDWYAFSYWKNGMAEDASAIERRSLKETK